jgi:VWFA-related protein
VLFLVLFLLALGPTVSSQEPAKPKGKGHGSGRAASTQDQPAAKAGETVAPDAEGDDSKDADQKEEESPFGETIFVRIVNVDVFVRDKDGNPVKGLKKEDFELYEGDKPIAITNFYEYEGGKEVATDHPVEPAKKERPKNRDEVFDSHPGLKASDVPEDQRLNLVVYVDQQNITPIARNKMFRFLRQFLNTKVTRDDRVMLVTYNRSLKVVRGFTSDPQLIADATYELEKHTGGRTTQQSDRIDVLKEIDEGKDCQMSMGRAKLYAENVFNDMQFTLDGLKTAIDQLAGVPGRKAMLYLSEGLQMRAGEDIFWAMDERYKEGSGNSNESGVGNTDCGNAIMESFHYDSSRRLTDIANTAAANRVTLYTIDAAGLRIGGLRSAEFGSIGLSTNIESIYTRNLQDTLMFLADKTGGKAIVNTNNFLEGLAKVGDDFDNFYSLGFQPSHAGTGRRYPLTVKIKKDVMREHQIKAENIRSRDSYRDKPLEQEMGDATLAALNFGFESNNHGVRLEVGEVLQGERNGEYVVHLLIKVPIDSLQLYPLGNSDTWEARMRLWVQAIDGEGRTSQVQEQRWTLQPPIPTQDLETVKQKYTTFELPMVMRRGDQRVAVAFRDEISAKTSYVTQHVTVG